MSTRRSPAALTTRQCKLRVYTLNRTHYVASLAGSNDNALGLGRPKFPQFDNAVETTFFRYTSIIGDSLHARSPAGQRTEAVLACNILNQMTDLGRPDSLCHRSLRGPRVGIVRGAKVYSCTNATENGERRVLQHIQHAPPVIRTVSKAAEPDKSNDRFAAIVGVKPLGVPALIRFSERTPPVAPWSLPGGRKFHPPRHRRKHRDLTVSPEPQVLSTFPGPAPQETQPRNSRAQTPSAHGVEIDHG